MRLGLGTRFWSRALANGSLRDWAIDLKVESSYVIGNCWDQWHCSHREQHAFASIAPGGVGLHVGHFFVAYGE